MTHTLLSSQFRKPSSPLKQKLSKHINSPPCAPIGFTRRSFPCANNHCGTRYEKIFRHKRTHTNRKAATNQHSRHNHKVHRKLHQGTHILHTKTTRPYNVISKLVFPKEPHLLYLTFTLQTYHHPEHWFRSWPTHMASPSHLHTQAQV